MKSCMQEVLYRAVALALAWLRGGERWRAGLGRQGLGPGTLGPAPTLPKPDASLLCREERATRGGA